MTDTDLAELARLQGLRDAATPGPWKSQMFEKNEPASPDIFRVCTDDDSHEATLCELWSGEHDNKACAAFIASAHDAVAVAERLAKRLREARAEVIEQCALAVDQMKNGLTASVGEAGGLVPDQDGPWFLKSECAAAIRALKPTEGKP